MDELRCRHAEPGRCYHTWQHIEALLALFVELRPRLHDQGAVLDAILFHDAVYDPAASPGRNEAQSADLFAHMVQDSVSPARLSRTRMFILATARHVVPEELDGSDAADCALFLDMDMAILGSGPEAYDAYAAAVAEEYLPHVGEKAYRAGRMAFLQSALDRPRLFQTDFFHGRLDSLARANMTRELAALQAPA